MRRNKPLVTLPSADGNGYDDDAIEPYKELASMAKLALEHRGNLFDHLGASVNAAKWPHQVTIADLPVVRSPGDPNLPVWKHALPAMGKLYETGAPPDKSLVRKAQRMFAILQAMRMKALMDAGGISRRTWEIRPSTWMTADDWREVVHRVLPATSTTHSQMKRWAVDLQACTFLDSAAGLDIASAWGDVRIVCGDKLHPSVHAYAEKGIHEGAAPALPELPFKSHALKRQPRAARHKQTLQALRLFPALRRAVRHRGAQATPALEAAYTKWWLSRGGVDVVAGEQRNVAPRTPPSVR